MKDQNTQHITFKMQPSSSTRINHTTEYRICLCDLAGKVVGLNCGQAYHRECLTGWENFTPAPSTIITTPFLPNSIVDEVIDLKMVETSLILATDRCSTFKRTILSL